MKKTLYSIGVLLVVGIFAYYAATTLSNNQNTNITKIDEEFTTFTANEIGLKVTYPETWERYYNYTDDFGFALELKSDTQTTITDPITNQTGSGPLSEFQVFQNENVDGISLSEWISERTTSEDEQERASIEKDGYSGFKQWIWHHGNPFASSTISYYLDIDGEYWEFRGDINNDNPESAEFENSKGILQSIFDSIEIE